MRPEIYAVPAGYLGRPGGALAPKFDWFQILFVIITRDERDERTGDVSLPALPLFNGNNECPNAVGLYIPAARAAATFSVFRTR